jgi:hypothetical protein
MAEPVECFRVLAAAVPAERPRCLYLLVAAVLAWFGLDEHCLKPSTFRLSWCLVSVPSIFSVEGFVFFYAEFSVFTLNSEQWFDEF